MDPDQTQKSRAAADPPLLELEPRRQPETAWVAIGIGLVFVVVVVALAILLLRGPRKPSDDTPPAYASHLTISNVKMSVAQNFVGATVTYIEGKITNSGDKTVAGATIEATFQNSLGEVVQRERLALMTLDRSGAYPDAIDLRLAPLKPQQTRDFRLSFEHVSNDWNQQYPSLRTVRVSLR